MFKLLWFLFKWPAATCLQQHVWYVMKYWHEHHAVSWLWLFIESPGDIYPYTLSVSCILSCCNLYVNPIIYLHLQHQHSAESGRNTWSIPPHSFYICRCVTMQEWVYVCRRQMVFSSRSHTHVLVGCSGMVQSELWKFGHCWFSWEKSGTSPSHHKRW